LLQIWIEPSVKGIEPSYEEKHFSAEEKRGKLCLIASPEGQGASVIIHQNAKVYVGHFDGAEQETFQISQDRRIYVHLAQGELSINGVRLKAGDALKLVQESALEMTEGVQAEVLVFDLP